MILKGLQKLTLLDFPGKTACTVFTGGCNFLCPFCHNSDLIKINSDGYVIREVEFFAFLEKRRKLLDGVCISGGEPLLQVDLKSFIMKIKNMGYSVKLDTNGSCPEKLKSLVEKQLVDYVAMDIKNTPEKYPVTAGCKQSVVDKVKESVEFLLSGKVDFEFRTTVVKELHMPQDIVSIGKWISGSEKYFLQQYRDSENVLEEGLSAYSDEEMRKIKAILSEWLPNVEIRGI